MAFPDVGRVPVIVMYTYPSPLSGTDSTVSIVKVIFPVIIGLGVALILLPGYAPVYGTLTVIPSVGRVAPAIIPGNRFSGVQSIVSWLTISIWNVH